jgi:hypothetical protein
MSKFDFANDETVGYWGPKTAAVDWCEPNFDTSYYIAEFWNTITSLPVCYGKLFFLHYKEPEIVVIIISYGNSKFFIALSCTKCKEQLKFPLEFHTFGVLTDLVGLFLIYKGMRYNYDHRIFLCGALLALTGFGSALFHGTLLCVKNIFFN